MAQDGQMPSADDQDYAFICCSGDPLQVGEEPRRASFLRADAEEIRETRTRDGWIPTIQSESTGTHVPAACMTPKARRRKSLGLRRDLRGQGHGVWSGRGAVMLVRNRGNFLTAIAATTRGEPLVCTLTRIGRKLDDDNLASAFKAVRDQVAAELGVDDGSDAVAWRYAQERGPAGIRIEIANGLGRNP